MSEAIELIEKDLTRLRAAIKSARRNQNVVAQHNLASKLDSLLAPLQAEIRQTKTMCDRIVALKKQVVAPLVNLKPDFVLAPPPGYVAAVYFDIDEAYAMYTNAETGDVINIDWPFDVDYVYEDDCERLGFAVEN